MRLTNRLTDSPACLDGDEHALSPHVERLLRERGQEVPEQHRTLELNPDHPVVQRMQAMCESDADEGELARWSGLLHDQALLAEGSMPDDPAGLAKRIAELMQKTVE